MYLEKSKTFCYLWDMGCLKLTDEKTRHPLKVVYNRADNFLLGRQEKKQGSPKNYVSTYQYKYNGKELQDELGLNVYGMDARGYDSAIGRFNVVDPMAAFAPSYTPYRFGFNNPVYWTDPTGMYEYDNDGNVVLRYWDEIVFFQDYMDNGGTVEGLEMALQDAGFGLDLAEAKITGKAKSKNNGSQFAFSSYCIVGCHQTPGGFSYSSATPLFKRTNETFYWFSGGRGSGYGDAIMRPGDKIEFSDLLEWLSISRMSTPSSMETQGLADIFTLVQMWNMSGSSSSVMDALAPPQAKDTIIKTTVREANSAYRGAYKHKDGGFGRTGTFYRSKDTIIHTTTDKVEKVKSIIDSIDNSRL